MIIDNPNINAKEMRVGVNFSLDSTYRLGKVTDDRHRAGVKQSSKVSNTTLILPTPGMLFSNVPNTWISFLFQIDATISEKAEIKASFSRDRPPLCPPGSALNPYLAPDKIPSASRMGNAEPKKTDIDSTYHDWDEEDDRRDLDYFTEVERRSRVNNQKKESESDREDSQSRISGGVDADTNWLTTNFDEE